MTKLRHGQQIRVKGFRFRRRITVGTARGYAGEYGEDAEASHRCAKDTGSEVFWTNQDPGMLEADHPQKKTNLAQNLQDWEGADELHEGQIVEIESEPCRVKVVGEGFANPVSFLPLSRQEIEELERPHYHPDYLGCLRPIGYPNGKTLARVSAVSLIQTTQRRYAVVYGLQTETCLSEEDAASQFGSCCIHQAKCEGWTTPE